ncbi:NosD domain-containing protein, partial [Acinetobacter baumannii]
NRIERIAPGNGIRLLAGSFGNLILRNRVAESGMDAVDMRGKTNYLVDNDFSGNRGLGIHLRALGNHIARNRICRNDRGGVADRTGLNLLYDND